MNTLDGSVMLGKWNGLVGLKVPYLARLVTGSSEYFGAILNVTDCVCRRHIIVCMVYLCHVYECMCLCLCAQ